MSALQIGDVFRLYEFVWEVYHFGFSPEFRASTCPSARGLGPFSTCAFAQGSFHMGRADITYLPDLMSHVHPGREQRAGHLADRMLSQATNTKRFFDVVKDFADNLTILTRVVRGAQQSLAEHGAEPAVHPRWHLESLLDIVGNYETTLNECRQLINENKRFNETTGVGRNLEWNYMVQPAVDRLQERLLLYNARLLNVLKPFEM